MKHVYLDWNIFNNIEKIEELDESDKKIFSKIEQLIVDGQIICPYPELRKLEMVCAA